MMRYAEELRRLLLPLGVYEFGDGSFSYAQLEALGAELDAAYEELCRNQRQSIVLTADALGLERFEALFPYRSVAETIAARRAAIAGFLQISGDGFTLEALQRCMAACGEACLISEGDQPGHIRLFFPGVMGIPSGIERIRCIAEQIMPAHAQVEYCYRWCTWGETQQYGLRWGDVCKKTWHAWRIYTET